MRQNIIKKPNEVSILKWLSTMIMFFILTLSLSPSYARPNPIIQPISNQIQLACNATRHPQYCTTSLTQQSNLVLSSNDPTPIQIIQSAISVSTATLTVTQSKLQTLLTVANTQGNHNITNVVSICLEVLGYSNRRMSSSNDSISSGKSGRIKDVRAWMSAALSYQYDCYGGLTYYASNYAHLTGEPISSLTNLINETSNALGMVVSYDRFGNDMSLWRRVETERDGFWEESNHEAEFNSEFPSEYLQVDVIVCKESGYCGYKKIQEAVDAAPSNLVDSKRFVIHIREGVYEEIVRIPFEKKNVVFLGAGMGKTIITGDLAVNHQPGVTTYDSATVGVLGDGFMATNLTIQNAAGAPEHQAVAFRSDSDLSMLVNCEFLGNQDTLYAHSLRQYYKSCRITGNVDFIFGNAAAVFQNCLIQLVPRLDNPESGGLNAITAQGRTDPVQSTGFVFVNCTINGTPEYMALFDKNPSVHKNYLGRPWKEYSRAVFIHCELGSVVASEGWMPWDGEYGLNTLYYGEFGNRGDGFDRGKRVKWSSQVPEEHVDSYSLQSFIQGDWWIPKTHS
ncbi:Probable pectinesterase/pectinesterase inhibitor 51 [Linum grandiflorum]